MFSKDIYKIIGKDEAFVKDWLVHQGLEKLVDVFQGMFSNFRYFFITWKHKYKRQGELYSVYHKAITDVNTA